MFYSPTKGPWGGGGHMHLNNKTSICIIDLYNVPLSEIGASKLIQVLEKECTGALSPWERVSLQHASVQELYVILNACVEPGVMTSGLSLSHVHIS